MVNLSRDPFNFESIPIRLRIQYLCYKIHKNLCSFTRNRFYYNYSNMSLSIIVLNYISVILSKGWRKILKYVLGFIILILVIDLSGVLRHLSEQDYETYFSYPMDIPDFKDVVQKYRNGEPVPVKPINTFFTKLSYLSKAEEGCSTDSNENPFRLILLVKSAARNFDKRQAIRDTWGNPHRFSDVSIKTVFILGKSNTPHLLVNALDGKIRPMQYAITAENGKFGDIIYGDFMDTYYNNTVKTLLSMRWLVETCPNFRYVIFIDDDMYLSVKNLLKYLRNPAEYPEYWIKQMEMDEKRQRQSLSGILKTGGSGTSKNETIWKNHPMDFDIELSDDTKLFTGPVLFVPPHRHKIGTKWFVPISEYPYNYYPPYVPAGMMVLSKAAFLDIYYGSFYTVPYRFDDIFVAIIAKKMGIIPFHSEYFKTYNYEFSNGKNGLFNFFKRSKLSELLDKYLIVAHDYEPNELRRVWWMQKQLGNA